MSIVATIRRPGAAPLSRLEIEGALNTDPNFTRDEVGGWRLTGSVDPGLFLNVEEAEAWTDGSSLWLREPAIGSLRAFASKLDARVFGEEDEDITCSDAAAEDTPPEPTGKLSTVLAALLGLALLPILVVVALLRLPWVLWQVTRHK